MIGYNKSEIVGKMRERVILQNRIITQSDSGFQSEIYNDIGIYWSKIEYKTGFEEEDADKITNQQKINITLRYNILVNVNSRFVYRNELYQVEKVEYSDDRRFMTCVCVWRSSYTSIYAGSIFCSASLLAQSSLSAALMRVIKYQASLNAFGSVSADIALVQKVASSLNAFGTLTGDISFVQNMQAALNGTAALSGGINFVQKVQASLLTSSSVTGNIIIPKLVQASLTGSGTTAANLTVTAAASLLLDLYPSAAVAYSLRKLRSAYTGSAIRVRRSSDNTEQDIGFTGNDLNTSALTTFCGAGNGFVTTWYDQSGNAQNATMSTQANQPQIVSSGVVVTQNGKPTLQYDGTNDGLNATVTGINNTTALCLFYAYSSNLAAAANTNTAYLWWNGDFPVTHLRGHFSSTGNLTGEYLAFDTRKTFTGGERIGSTTYRRSGNTLVVENTFFLTNGTSFQQNNNNISLDLLSGATLSENLTPSNYNTSTKLNVGYNDLGVFANQKISEFIVYLSDQTTNRSNINGNINTHYAIY